MFSAVLSVHAELAAAGRIRSAARAGGQISVLELVALMACGAAAALASAWIETPWQLPGQAVVQSVFPMALGMALVPRRWAGSLMGCSALATVAGLRAGGLGGVGFGALTSLALTGPMLDVALWNTKLGWRLYARVIGAGLATNLLALGVRLAVKYMSGDLSGGRRLASWLPEAIWSYPLCGIIAGLVSAAAWFHFSSQQRGRPDEVVT